ncbi:uncharacterized protein LOC143242769 [Tachypleus tridentatus]|uniref:uncharacterized protein LOC143242769 n=1 Tax=Tachypleus tridentatus TaxID=6853 RepID=UPI003FD36357
MEFLMTKLKQKLDTMSRNCSKKKTFIWTEKVKLMLLIKLLKMPRNLLRNIAVNLESIHWKYCLYFLTLRLWCVQIRSKQALSAFFDIGKETSSIMVYSFICKSVTFGGY